jgi:hypothetical protein
MAEAGGTFGSRTPESAIPGDFASAASLLQSLVSSRKLLKTTLKDPAIATAFDVVGKTARAAEGEQRLHAVALLGKVAEISKPVAAIATPLLKAALFLPLPPIGSWGTADDRYYLAKGVSASTDSWIPSYAAVELARADVAERASRELWAAMAINRAKSVTSALETIGKVLSEDSRSPTYSVETANRKLNRIAIALHDFLPTADVPSGEGFGRAFSRIVVEVIGQSPLPNRSLRLETAINVLTFMVQTLRLRFDVTLDADVYRAAGTILRWWRPARPPDAVSSLSERIARIAMATLHTLARQGLPQRNLRHALVSAFGAELVNRLGGQITAADPSLDQAIASWLSDGQELVETRSSTAVREINEQELDQLIGRLMLAVDTQEGGPESLDLLADEISLLEPRHAATLRMAASRGLLIAQWAKATASRRRLLLSGKRGELVTFDPAIHEADGDFQVSARGRVRVPGVVKQEEGRPPRIILKGVVESP